MKKIIIYETLTNTTGYETFFPGFSRLEKWSRKLTKRIKVATKTHKHETMKFKLNYFGGKK